MVAPRKRTPRWHRTFLAMLPKIYHYATIAFRNFTAEARQEGITEVVANACVAFHRLVKKGKVDLAYPGVLATYGIKQYFDERRVGNRRSISDVLSPFCQKKKGVKVERLDHFDEEEGEWMETIIEDRHAGPAETAAARIDIGDWFRSMPSRKRRIAQALAIGERTTDVAKRFRLSAGRISQMRDEFRDDWQDFNGEAAEFTCLEVLLVSKSLSLWTRLFHRLLKMLPLHSAAVSAAGGGVRPNVLASVRGDASF